MIQVFPFEYMFQSPRSGKFESNKMRKSVITVKGIHTEKFQSPRSGKFESNLL